MEWVGIGFIGGGLGLLSWCPFWAFKWILDLASACFRLIVVYTLFFFFSGHANFIYKSPRFFLVYVQKPKMIELIKVMKFMVFFKISINNF